jgi:hypothetical protein
VNSIAAIGDWPFLDIRNHPPHNPFSASVEQHFLLWCCIIWFGWADSPKLLTNPHHDIIGRIFWKAFY